MLNELPKSGMTILGEIATERLRQIEAEGWTLEHYDEHELGELAQAGAAYALMSIRNYDYAEAICPDCWPWEFDWFKPKNPRRDLVRAAALIIAEIERIDRAKGEQSD